MKIEELKKKKTNEVIASIFLTNRCNNNCPHCYINLPLEAKVKELSVKTWCAIIDQLVENGFTALGFTGGEPSVYPGFKEVYLHAKKKGLAILLMTNATNFSEEIKEMFYEYPPRKILATIYGINEETYAAVTGNKKGWEEFSKNLEFMEKLKRDKKVKLQFVTIMTKETHKILKEIEELAVKYQGHWANYSSILYSRIDGDPVRDKMIAAVRLGGQEQEKMLLEARRGGEFFPQEPAKNYGPPHRELFPCMVGKKENIVYFYKDGQMSICSLIVDPRYTVQFTTEELENFDYKKAKAKLDKKFEPLFKLEMNEKCAACSLRVNCYSCPAKNIGEEIPITGYNKDYCVKDILAKKLKKKAL